MSASAENPAPSDLAGPTESRHREKALILGATGGFGRAILDDLLARGYPVRVMTRSPAQARRGPNALPSSENEPSPASLEVIAGDARDQDDLLRAAEGCGIIVHAVNVPYHQWYVTMPEITSRIIAAACPEKARIVFPGNVYPFGMQTEVPLGEDAEFQPCSRKGELRQNLELFLKRACQDNHIRALIIRAGDFFGPTVRNGLTDPIFRSAIQNKPMRLLGWPDAAHQWAYVPDVTRLTCDLLELGSEPDRLRPFEVVHHAGKVWTPQYTFHTTAAERAGHPGLQYRPLSWRMLQWVGRLQRAARELLELSYLFDAAVILDDPRRRELLPDFQATDPLVAIDRTLASYRAEETA